MFTTVSSVISNTGNKSYVHQEINGEINSDASMQQNTLSKKKNELLIGATAWMNLKIIMLFVLKDKLRYIKFLKSLSRHRFQLGSAKPKVIRSTSPTGDRGKVFIEEIWKQSKEII